MLTDVFYSVILMKIVIFPLKKYSSIFGKCNISAAAKVRSGLEFTLFFSDLRSPIFCRSRHPW